MYRDFVRPAAGAQSPGPGPAEGSRSSVADQHFAGPLSGLGTPLEHPLRWAQTPAYPLPLPSVSTNTVPNVVCVLLV